MRTQYDEQLVQLHKEIITMGALCENAIEMATKAMAEGDTEIGGRVLEMSLEIDRKERDIEALCMKLLLKQQPVATDLRVVSSALKMITDMERIGNNSWDIAEIVTMANITREDDTRQLQEMAKATIKMVTDSTDAFVRQDVELARAVIDYDDVVDGHFNTIKMSLIQQFGRLDAAGEKVLDQLMIAKYLERMSDHAVEIAKWVLFAITGERPE